MPERLDPQSQSERTVVVRTGRCPCGNLGRLYVSGQYCRDCADVLTDGLSWIRGEPLIVGLPLRSTFDLDRAAL